MAAKLRCHIPFPSLPALPDQLVRPEERLHAPLQLALHVLECPVVPLAAQDLQIFGAVVAPVAVDVVHDLAQCQRPPERLFRQHAVRP